MVPSYILQEESDTPVPAFFTVVRWGQRASKEVKVGVSYFTLTKQLAYNTSSGIEGLT